MAIPYRSMPKSAAVSFAAYLHVAWRPELKRFFGGLLVSDGRGQPIEFVHTHANAPAGLLWSEEEVRRVAVQAISHSLFDGCGKAPGLLIAPDTIGTPAFCSDELSPSVPFGLVSYRDNVKELELSWIGAPPAPGTAASLLADELKRRSLLWEPFARIEMALREVYPELSSVE